MATSRTRAMVGDMLKVKGRNSATAMDGEIPGMAPPRIPAITPMVMIRIGWNPTRIDRPFSKLVTSSIARKLLFKKAKNYQGTSKN